MSLFTSVLGSLLDETDLFEREDWAKVLEVTPERIQGWLEEKEIPTPNQLFTILQILQDSTNIPDAPVKAFHEMCNMPAREVSSLGVLMLPNVRIYIHRPAFSVVRNTLAKLSQEEQRNLLEELYPA